MNKSDPKKNRYAATLAMLPVLAAFLILLSLKCGSVPIGFEEIAGVLGGNIGGETGDIIMKIRFPRTLAAFVLGGALSLSGYLMQSYFRNPIAGPYVLGVSSGARLFVALVMVFAMGGRIGSFRMISAAFLGALSAMGLVLLMSGVLKRMSLLIVAGIMMGYICNAVTDFIVTFAQEGNIVSLHGWSKGSFSGMDWEGVAVISILTMLCFLASFMLSKPLGAYLMGEEYALSLGVNIMALRVFVILLSSFLAACVTAFAGPVSFVGIAVPQISLRLIGSSKPVLQVPAVFLCGGVFCVLCDIIARMAFAPAELSISTVTALFGAPVVISVLIRRQQRNGS